MPPPSSKKAGALESLDAIRLMQELDVHRIELETQNEELRAARRDVEIALAFYTELFDFAPIGYATLRSDGGIVRCNHTGARLLGSSRSQLTHRKFVSFVRPENRDAFRAVLADASVERRHLEVWIRDGSAIERLVRVSASITAAPLDRRRLEHSGERIVLLAFEDVTEHRDREAALARVEAELREAARRKDDFLATLSHELRNPLSPIQHGVYVLRNSPPDSKQAEFARDVIDRQAKHLTRLVEDLLDVNRIERGKVLLQMQPLDLEALVKQTLADYGPVFESAGILLSGKLETGSCWLEGDPARLVQILTNLLRNAERYTPRGGAVTVSLDRERSFAVLRVRDTGAGIPSAMLSTVFEPFIQGKDPGGRTAGGLGLGLAMVRGLVELHAGEVSIASDGHDAGTEVTVRLPLIAGEAYGAPTPATSPGSDGRPSIADAGQSCDSRAERAERRTVLVIAKDAPVAASLKASLRLRGHDVETAEDGPTGLAFARTNRPNVVLCQLNLPGMDGFAVARAFREIDELAATHLVAIGNDVRPEDTQRSVDAGFDHHIGKPPCADLLDQLMVIGRATRITPEPPP